MILTMNKTIPAYLCALFFGVILNSCQPTFDSGYTRITEGTLPLAGSPSGQFPLPKSKPILTVSGRIHRFNQGETFVMDRDMIEAVGLVENSVLDPYEKANYRFRGVLVRDLLNLWQVDPEATILDLKALDGYRIEIPIQMFKDYPVLLALKQNNEYLKPNYRGPAMLVFPYQSYHLPSQYMEQYWIWQLTSKLIGI
jgi:hypothetical protein